MRILSVTPPSPRGFRARVAPGQTSGQEEGVGAVYGPRDTQASRESHEGKGDVKMIVGHPKLLAQPPWWAPTQIPEKAPCQEGDCLSRAHHKPHLDHPDSTRVA